MSSPNETELLAGHAPAAKVGGMRVTSHKSPKPPAEESSPPADDAEAGEEEVAIAPKKDAKLVIAGFVTKGDKDFPPEAVKSYHEKPQPTHDNRKTSNHTNNQTINQPRKQ